MKKEIATMILALSFTGACTDENQEKPNKKQQAMQSAEATGKLMSLSNSSLGMTTLQKKSNITADFQADMEESIQSFKDSLVNASCFTYSMEALQESEVKVKYDFSDCQIESGLENMDGSFEATVAYKEAKNQFETDFKGDIYLDGYKYVGAWGIDMAENGAAAITGDFDLQWPDGEILHTNLNGSWDAADAACPILSQHINLGEGDDEINLDLSGFNICEASLSKGASVDIMVDDTTNVDLPDVSEADVPETDVDGEYGVDQYCQEL